MTTPVFHTHGFQDVGELLSVRVVAVGLFALVSLLLAAALLALVLLTDDTPAWAFPVGLAVLWKLGLFDWVTDIRTARALHHSPAQRRATEVGVNVARRWLLDPRFPATVAQLGGGDMHLVVYWAWTPQGLKATSFVATTGSGATVNIGLSHGWDAPIIPWDDPSLAGLRGRKADLLEGRWKMDVVTSTQALPVASAHARLALIDWAQHGAAAAHPLRGARAALSLFS
jgi:hypothetical protein